MPRINILRETCIVRSARVMQLEGLFDLEPANTSRVELCVDFDLPEDWSIGLIIGPSGAGKSTVARELFGEVLDAAVFNWPTDRSIVDAFPQEMGIKKITELLSSVGFSSPPSWLRPYHVLSNGEKFRVDLARIIGIQRALAVVDEFTSVVDRNVAKIGSAAVAKTVRRRGGRFVAVSCHYDIIDWLDPDWIYEPHLNKLTRRSLRGRPKIDLVIRRVHHSAWQMFARHHYLSGNLHRSAKCFVAFVGGEPAAFGAFMHFPHPSSQTIKREHRIVCLPDYQGVGIGNILSAQLGALAKTMGYQYRSVTSHPAMIRARAKSKIWDMQYAPHFGDETISSQHTNNNRRVISTRMIISFKYVGPPMEIEMAKKLWAGE